MFFLKTLFHHESEASLVYRVTYRAARATQKNIDLKKKKNDCIPYLTDFANIAKLKLFWYIESYNKLFYFIKVKKKNLIPPSHEFPIL